ncbi:MAG TPA: ABC transporter substrate-binding protein [Opitutaceae bacterium]
MSALLLVSDLGSRVKPAPPAGDATASSAADPAPTKRHVNIAVLQHASQLVLDQGRAGMFAGLADRGWEKDRNYTLKYYNAEGDMATAQNIAKAIVGDKYDIVITISTPSLQAVANANRVTKLPHVFGLVTDPYGAGVGINRDNHLDHPPYLAGYGTMQPIALAFKTAREMNPALATVGVVWNAAESNSEAQVKLARVVCAELGITLLESTVDNSAGVAEAAAALVARGVDALWAGGDVTVMSAIDSLIGAGRKGRIPTFTVIPPNAKRGALFDLGANYEEVGRLTGQLAGDILNGKNPATVSIDNVMPEVLTLNLQALAGLKAKWTLSDTLRQRAQLIIDEQGVEQAKPTKTASATPSSRPQTQDPRAAPGRSYKIGFAAFAPEPSLETCQRGLLEGLKELGFIEGQNLTVARTHAQGEMVNIPQMLQAMDSSDAQAIATFSTPVLQSALTTAKRKPVVFTYVTDPLAAGAGVTYENHHTNVTGIGSLPPIADTIAILKRTLPNVKTLGTLYNSGEANSVKIISLLREATKAAGIQLVELTAASSNEVLQAMQALVTRRIDAFYLPSDNTAYLAFDAILKVADGAKLPVIIDDPDYVDRGALFACGPGYYHSGRAAAPLLARVLLGESPEKIPFANVSVNVTRFNRNVVARLGLSIPASVMAEIESSDLASSTPAPAAAPRQTQNPNPTGKKWKIAYVLYNETPPAEETLAGMKDAWKDSPLVAGRDYEISLRSAQGDIASLSGIIDAALTDGADLIVPFSTPTLQLALKRVKNKPILFTLIANPVAAGAGRTFEDHLPNLTGVSTLAPLREALDLIQKYFPQYKRLGSLYCPNEANSVDLKAAFEIAARERGLELEFVPANTASDLPDAALALMSRKIDAVVQISDNLSASGFTALARAARQTQKPLIGLNSTMVPLGAAIAFGRDYHDAGVSTVRLIERFVQGEDLGKIPFVLPPKVMKDISLENARAVGMTIPQALLDEANAGKGPPAAKPAPVAPAPAKKSASLPKKKWKIALVLYNETPPAEETLEGMKAAWKRSEFVEGRDYEIKVRSAQGDMALLSGIFDAALTDGADMVVTLSTPTLQMAVQKVKRIPIVFALVTDPMAAGAGKSYTDHLPNVTGIAVLAPMGEALDMIKKHFPTYKRVGTLYCPAEANAVYLKEHLAAACRERGFVLETVAVNSATELSDAALSLVSRKIDVILQIPDALSSTGFTAITRAARQRQTPLFALNGTVVQHGAAVAMGRDFHNSGEAAVAVIERIFRGESPANIPITLPPKISYVASMVNAKAVGVTLPPALLKDVQKLVD